MIKLTKNKLNFPYKIWSSSQSFFLYSFLPSSSLSCSINFVNFGANGRKTVWLELIVGLILIEPISLSIQDFTKKSFCRAWKETKIFIYSFSVLDEGCCCCWEKGRLWWCCLIDLECANGKFWRFKSGKIHFNSNGKALYGNDFPELLVSFIKISYDQNLSKFHF